MRCFHIVNIIISQFNAAGHGNPLVLGMPGVDAVRVTVNLGHGDCPSRINFVSKGIQSRHVGYKGRGERLNRAPRVAIDLTSRASINGQAGKGDSYEQEAN